MKFTSQIVTAASGSVGGCTYSRNRYGNYIRGRSVPVNPSSSFQNTVRGALATLVARWTSILNDAARDGWNTWAFNTPQTDALGNPITLTGQNAFIKMNAPRIQAGVAVIDTAPVVYAGAVLTPPTIISATASTEVLSIGFTNTDVWANFVGGHLLVYTGRPQNPSKNFFNGPYRYAGRINGAVSPPSSPLPITSAFVFEENQRIHVKFRAIDADARISTDWKASIISV